MQTLWQDVRYAVRLALRRPALSAVTILTLAIGVGGNTATFSVVNALLLRPLPVPNADRVVRVFGATETQDFDVMSYPNAVDLGSRSATLASLAIHQQTFVAYGLGEATEPAAVELVTGNYFSTLGLAAAHGRVLTPDDDQLDAGQQVAVISDRWWHTRLGAAREAIGAQMFLNGAAFTVVGIMPSTFHGSYDALGTDLWVPLNTHTVVRPRGNRLTNRGWGWLAATARLKPGVTVAQARAELSGLAAALEREYPNPNRGVNANVVEALALPEEAAPMLRRVLLFALVVVGLALAAACANIANAQLATVIARQREIAVRLALGATRGRVLRQWFTESALLALVATVAGLFVAVWARDVILMLRPDADALQNLTPNLALDWRVLGFTAVVAGAVAVLFGGLPAARAARVDVTTPLKDEGVTSTSSRRRTYAQSALVVTQVAVSLALLVSAGLLVRSLAASSAFDVGFNTSHLLIAEADGSGLGYAPDRTRAYFRTTMDRIRALPGVRDVTLGAVVPLGGSRESRGVIIDGYTPPNGQTFVSVANNIVGTNYFEMMGIPIVAGRGFQGSDGDDEAAVVAVVNETMARRYWPDGNPIGRQLRLGKTSPPVQIVGIAKDITYYAVGETPRPYLYMPFGPVVMGSLAFHIRTDGAGDGLPPALRREIRASDPRIRVPVAMPYERLRRAELYPARMMAGISATFGVLALMLTVVGLYGLVMYSVSQRTREFAVRLALGARPAALMRGVLAQGLIMTAIGAVVGLGLALALARGLQSFLFGVSALDPITLVGWTAVLMAVSTLAAYLPARRATRIDPAAVLAGRTN